MCFVSNTFQALRSSGGNLDIQEHDVRALHGSTLKKKGLGIALRNGKKTSSVELRETQ